MYKNVLNQRMIALFLLFSSCFLTVTARAQSTESSSPQILANAAIKSTNNLGSADNQQTVTPKVTEPDTSWHPQRRLWGYAFGDAYYDAHSPALTSTLGKENNYYQTPSNRNAFQFRRIYLGYDYDINQKFRAEVLLASEPNENTTPTTATSSVVGGDNLADGKMAFYIKNFNLRVREVWVGTDFVIGEMSTPSFSLNEPGTNGPTSLSEATWSYRSIERTLSDFHRNNAYDVGAALQGTFDPKTKNFGYVVMVGDNTTSSLTTVYNPNNALSATNPNPNTGFFKMFYGDLWAKFLDQHLYVDLYADYAKTSSTQVSTAVADGTLGPQEHNMFKIFAAYTMPAFTFGVEAYTQNFTNGVTDNTTKEAAKATVTAISLWLRGTVVKNKWSYFARFDSYNPDTKFIAADNYTANTNYTSYDPTVKEQFYTAGLDYTPAKNIHFMPNVWLTRYSDQYDASTKGYLPDNHTLVYRMTFFYVFGK